MNETYNTGEADMLKIYYGDIDNVIYNTSVYFRFNYDPRWFEDPDIMQRGTIKLYSSGRVVCPIKVEQPKLKSSLVLKIGKSKHLKLSGIKQRPDKWESSDPYVVSVTGDGMLKATDNGNAMITATIGNHRYMCGVHVK